MDISAQSVEALRAIIEGEKKNIVLLTHTNPDGDAIGSSLAWGAMLEDKGHHVDYIIPNRYPYFLSWMPGIRKFMIFKDKPEPAGRSIREADIIFCLDFNQINRLELLSCAVELNKQARFILIDHHLNPPEGFELVFSHPESSSTSYLVYTLMSLLGYTDRIDKDMSENIYVGIMTDTGNFSYSNLEPELFRTVATLVEKGVDIPEINKKVYNNFTYERVKLLGYTLNKMETIQAGPDRAAFMWLTEAELRKFNFQAGDSEGFVNYPLAIRDVVMSAIFIETKQFIRISLRSRGDVDVSAFSGIYFEGGGHKNAAGGKSFLPMTETLEKYKEAVKEYFGEKISD